MFALFLLSPRPRVGGWPHGFRTRGSTGGVRRRWGDNGTRLDPRRLIFACMTGSREGDPGAYGPPRLLRAKRLSRQPARSIDRSVPARGSVQIAEGELVPAWFGLTAKNLIKRRRALYERRD